MLEKEKNVALISNLTEYDFIIFGACCQRSLDTFNHLKEALIELGIDEAACNVGDNLQIAQYGVMRTPALAVQQKIVSQGKYLSVAEIKTLIKENYHV